MQFCGNQDRAKKIVVRTPAKTPGTTSSGQQTNEKKWHSSKNIFSSGFGSSWTSAESGGVGSGRGSVNCSPMQAGSSQAMTAPEPFPGWTVHEQKVLMDQIDANQHSKKHHKHLEMLFEKTHRQLPGKSLKEIEACYNHVRSKQIAYFGIKGKQSTLSGNSMGSIDQSASFLVAGTTRHSSPEVKRSRRGSV